MTTERPISKEHTEQIWEAILAAAAQGSLDAAIAASELINARRLLDEQITQTSEPDAPNRSTPQDPEDRHSPSQEGIRCNASGEQSPSPQGYSQQRFGDLQLDWRRRTKAYLLLLDLLDKRQAHASKPQLLGAEP